MNTIPIKIIIGVLATIGAATLFLIAMTLWAYFSDEETYEYPMKDHKNKPTCENLEKCIDYSGMVMDSTAVDCHGCHAYVPTKLIQLGRK